VDFVDFLSVENVYCDTIITTKTSSGGMIVSQDNEQSYISRTSGLKAKDYIGYAMVDLAGCLVFALVTTLLQKFYTDIFHLSPLFIMIMFIVARV
jgi:hypothetical protein